ncbi:GNAT family N-acetyltransferase [Micromonospora sp. HSS6-12]|uniref:GNAT family N-acetyltransferase n=1 Tax=Micromonospora thermarum TaxID=2720024 RepID=A0ABX0Z5J5_9ACTN|nr:GNAT family N-acetyltransferase [Micromonospora thermarum]
MELTAFGPSHAASVAGWARSAEETRRWCSRDEVTPEVVAGWSAAPDAVAYVAVVDGEPVAYGELWLDDEEAEVELARLIVAPAYGGRGLGHHPAVFMRVHPDNEPALRCWWPSPVRRSSVRCSCSTGGCSCGSIPRSPIPGGASRNQPTGASTTARSSGW